MGDKPNPEMAGRPLTPREREALRLYALMPLYRLVAARMRITESTVKDHLWAAHVKLDVPTSIDAFRKLGWLVVP